MARYSVNGVERIGIMEEIYELKANRFVSIAFERKNGSAIKIQMGENPLFLAVWYNLNKVTNPLFEVKNELFINLGNKRTTILGFGDPEQEEACINTLRQQAGKAGLGGLVTVGVADRKGGIGVGIIKSLVAIRSENDPREVGRRKDRH